MFTVHRRFFRVGRRDLAYLKFIIEAYDGLATLSTVEREGAIVSITAPSCRAADIDRLIEALSRETEMIELPMPSGTAEDRGGEDHA